MTTGVVGAEGAAGSDCAPAESEGLSEVHAARTRPVTEMAIAAVRNAFGRGIDVSSSRCNGDWLMFGLRTRARWGDALICCRRVWCAVNADFARCVVRLNRVYNLRAIRDLDHVG